MHQQQRQEQRQRRRQQRALHSGCNLQIYAARSSHTELYTIHTYIVVMMHNQKLNSARWLRPDQMVFVCPRPSLVPSPSLRLVKNDALVGLAACLPAIASSSSSSNCNCCNVLFCKIFNLPDVQRWPNWKNTMLGMGTGEWRMGRAIGGWNSEERIGSVLNRNKHNFHENQYINFRHI